ncbi:MAG: sigma-70 family RNA polymerase sigma factor [Planctomycetes bacterium]|nr:sigma-70 family RNA polymerase sigma factor [Planctomycetota bacterium]
MEPSVFPATRWSLIARLGDQPQQVAVLVGLYADAIAAYLAGKLAGERPERIDDTIQEVLLDLLGKPELLARAQPGSGSRFRHYLMSLAWCAARNALRHARRRDHASLEAEADDGGPPAPDQQRAMDRAWAVSVLQQAMEELRRQAGDGRLEPEALAVLQASLVEGRALRAVAAGTGLSLATCSRRLARARTLLQQAIAERLRLAGELGADEDPAQACGLLLQALAPA